MRTQNNILLILREMRKKLGCVIWYLFNLGIASDFLKSKFATLVTVQWNSSRSKYERNTFRHAAAMPYQIYQGFRISLSPHIPTSQRQSKGRPWIFHILCDCRPSKKGSPHIGAGIPSEISYWTFCASWQIHRGVSRGTPTLLCQIKQQYFAAKNVRFWASPDWVKCRDGGHLGWR